MFIDYSKIPGYLEAVRKEREGREFHFLGLNYEIARIEIRVMTLADFARLSAIHSPFVIGGSITAEDIGAFLWMLSPDHSATDKEVRAAFMLRVVQAMEAYDLREGIQDYLEMLFFDAPEGGGGGSSSLEISIVHLIASAYHWTEAEICAKSLPRLFQYINRIIGGPSFSRLSDGIKGDWLERLNNADEETRAEMLKEVAA